MVMIQTLFDSRTHEGELNKLGFWIFITARFALFGAYLRHY